VRVNDRGPFHEGRIIDLSYAAATKLDVIRTGTANVKIEHITTSLEPSPKPTLHYAIQVAASSNHQRAHNVLSNLVDISNQAGYLERNDGLTKIFMGPFNDYPTVQNTLKVVQDEGFADAFITKTQLKK
jgi:rare lipoprotein A